MDQSLPSSPVRMPPVPLPETWSAPAGNYGIGAFYQGGGLPIKNAIDVFGYANNKIGAGQVNNHSQYPGGTSEWQYIKQGYGDTDLNTKLYSQLGVPTVAPIPPEPGVFSILSVGL